MTFCLFRHFLGFRFTIFTIYTVHVYSTELQFGQYSFQLVSSPIIQIDSKLKV